MGNVDLSVIIVNWNTSDLLQRCLESLYGRGSKVDAKVGGPARTGLSFEVVVVDNASTDGSAAMVAERFPQTRLQENRANVGFTRANNQGITSSNGRYVLLLNSDAEIVGDALETIVTYLDTHSEVGVVGPLLLNSDGSVQSSRRRFPTLATGFVESTVLQEYLPRSGLLSRFYVDDIAPDSAHRVDWVVGACFAVRRAAIEQVGIMDEGFFMYFEEVDWCWRMKKAGWQVAFLPAAQVIHHYGKSSERDLPHRHIYFNDSKVKFYRKHFGLRAALLLRSFLLASYLFQFLREGLKFVVGHKRPLRKDRLVLLAKVLRSGLRA